MGESLLTGLHGLLRCASIRAAAQARHRVVGGDELRDLVRELILGRQVGSATRRLHPEIKEHHSDTKMGRFNKGELGLLYEIQRVIGEGTSRTGLSLNRADTRRGAGVGSAAQACRCLVAALLVGGA